MLEYAGIAGPEGSSTVCQAFPSMIENFFAGMVMSLMPLARLNNNAAAKRSACGTNSSDNQLLPVKICVSTSSGLTTFSRSYRQYSSDDNSSTARAEKLGR